MAKPLQNAQMDQFVEFGGKTWELALGEQWKVRDAFGRLTGRVNVHPYRNNVGAKLDNTFWVGFGYRKADGEQDHYIIGRIHGSQEHCLAEGLSNLAQTFPDMGYGDDVVLTEKESKTN